MVIDSPYLYYLLRDGQFKYISKWNWQLQPSTSGHNKAYPIIEQQSVYRIWDHHGESKDLWWMG